MSWPPKGPLSPSGWRWPMPCAGSSAGSLPRRCGRCRIQPVNMTWSDIALVVLAVCVGYAILAGLVFWVVVMVGNLRSQPPHWLRRPGAHGWAHIVCLTPQSPPWRRKAADWADVILYARPWGRRLLPLSTSESIRSGCHQIAVVYIVFLTAIVSLIAWSERGHFPSLADLGWRGALALATLYALFWTGGWAFAGFHPTPRPGYRPRAQLRRRILGRTPPPLGIGQRRRRRRWRRRARHRPLSLRLAPATVATVGHRFTAPEHRRNAPRTGIRGLLRPTAPRPPGRRSPRALFRAPPHKGSARP